MESFSKKKYKSPTKLGVINEQKVQQKDESYFVVSPSQRYFKRVYNKEYHSEKKPKQIKKKPQQSQISKSFTRSPISKKKQRYSHIEEQLYEEQKSQAVNNFSLRFLRKQVSDNNSLFDSTSINERSSKERKLNFSKIFIVQQNTPYKQVIQLSERELQNKEMLEKAVQQLEKRKLQKKFKMLKKQMRIDLSKHKMLDESIQDLRSHRIGYKTFYRNEVLSQRNDSKFQQSKKKIKDRQYSYIQSQEKQKLKSPQKNIFVLDDKRQQDSKDLNEIYNEQFLRQNKLQNRKKIVFNDKISQNQKYIQLPSVNKKLNFGQGSEKSSRTRKNDQKEKIHSYSMAQIPKPNLSTIKSHTLQFKSLRQLPSTTKSYNSLSRNLRNFPKQGQNQQKNWKACKTQQKQADKKNAFNDEFTLLLSRQDLQNTLDKSRYEMKKLLCVHIQNRKKQWRKNKSKSLLQEKFIDQQFQQITRSEKKIVGELKIIEETTKELENSQVVNETQVQSKISPCVAPTHLLKLHTKELKKSIKSFVKKVKNFQSPRKHLKKSPYIQ